MAQLLINEIGNKYGFLTPIKLTKDKNGRTAWLCQCDCGSTKIVRGSDLRTGRIVRCGKNCPTKKGASKNYKDETGNHYGRLTVFYRQGESNAGKIIWHCLCECGNECNVVAGDLRSGRTQSCGCLHKELAAKNHMIDISGQRFGSLTAIKRLPKQHNNNCFYWECLCDCGNIVEVPTSYLTSKNTQSCGCHALSHGENEISSFLDINHISYKKQYTFNDLIGTKRPLRFDFAIFDENNNLKFLIEYNGKQHYQPVERFGGEEKLKIQKQYDLKKQEYCKTKEIELYTIKYNENIQKRLEEIFYA